LTCAHEDLVKAGVPVHSHHAAHCANAPHQLQPAIKPYKITDSTHTYLHILAALIARMSALCCCCCC